MTYYPEKDPIADLVIHLAIHGPQDKLLAALTDSRGPLDAGFPALFSRKGDHPQWMTVDLALEALEVRPELAQAVALDRTTALHVAAEGHLARGPTAVYELLRAGAAPLIENWSGHNALDILSSSTDGTGRTGGEIQQIWPNQQAMLDQMIDHLEQEYGKGSRDVSLALENALRLACELGRLRTAEHLISRGAEPALDLMLEDDEDPATALELAAGIYELDMADKYQDQLVNLLLANTPEDRLAEHLANRGGDVTDVDTIGPLRAAAGRNRTNVMRILMKHGAVDTPGGEARATALRDASWNSYDEAVELLIKGDPKYGIPPAQADYVNLKDKHGNTALHYAMLEEMEQEEEDLKSIVNMLLDAGADPRIKNKDRKTPTELARLRECEDLASTMEQAAAALGPRAAVRSKTTKINTEAFEPDKAVATRPKPGKPG